LYDLLDFSALAHGEGIPLRKQRQLLNELVQRALDDARLRFPGRVLMDRLPTHEVWVEADASRIAQVLDNLISNAFVHGAHDAPVSVYLELAGAEVAVSVANAGAIPETARARLFQPSSHGEGALRRGSMGLGLYIVKQLVDAHGGRVQLTSDAHSTTFTVLLPRSAP
jgi:signal transduction histidine kinase